jgi:diguanylate cyclase (GGDEF)-like protein
VGDVRQDRRYVEIFPGIRSELAVPVMIGDDVLGVIDVESPQPDFFDEEDKSLLTAASAQFAVALSNINAQEKLKEQAVRDPLTNLFNRHYLNEVIDGEFDRADRYGREITLMMVDIDGFRRVNNTLGHLKGDLVLQRVARVLQESVRVADSVIRYGGDEFLILMPETTDSTGAVAQRLKENVEAIPKLLDMDDLKIGLSVGTYVRSAGDRHTVAEILAQADRRMYADKRASYGETDRADEYGY